MYNIYYIYVVCIYTIYIKRTPEYPIIVSEKCPVRSSHPQIQKKHFSPSQMMLQQKTIVFGGYRRVFDMRER